MNQSVGNEYVDLRSGGRSGLPWMGVSSIPGVKTHVGDVLQQCIILWNDENTEFICCKMKLMHPWPLVIWGNAIKINLKVDTFFKYVELLKISWNGGFWCFTVVAAYSSTHNICTNYCHGFLQWVIWGFPNDLFYIKYAILEQYTPLVDHRSFKYVKSSQKYGDFCVIGTFCSIVYAPTGTKRYSN